MADLTKLILPNNVEYNIKDAGAPRIADVPTATSDLTNDSGYIQGVGIGKVYVSATQPAGMQNGDLWVEIS